MKSDHVSHAEHLKQLGTRDTIGLLLPPLNYASMRTIATSNASIAINTNPETLLQCEKE